MSHLRAHNGRLESLSTSGRSSPLRLLAGAMLVTLGLGATPLAPTAKAAAITWFVDKANGDPAIP